MTTYENAKEVFEADSETDANHRLRNGWKLIGFYVFRHEEQSRDNPDRLVLKEEPRYVLVKHHQPTISADFNRDEPSM